MIMPGVREIRRAGQRLKDCYACGLAQRVKRDGIPDNRGDVLKMIEDSSEC